MHSTKTLILIVLIVAVAMLAVGYAIRSNGGVDNSEPTPSPSAGVEPSLTPLASAAPARSPMAYSVRLAASGPVPATLIIRAGDTVSLVGDDAQGFWPKSGDCPGFDAMRSLTAGERYTVTFKERRTCTYYDNRQPEAAGRHGTIIVQ